LCWWTRDTDHQRIVSLFDAHADDWVLPWAILPEVDYLLGADVSRRAQDMFFEDLAEGAYAVEWGSEDDLDEALRLTRKYRGLQFGMVDALVMAMAGRRAARAIVTLDLRHFRAVKIPGSPALWPRDLGS
jgi:predicted nucleic acid-binding protein